MRFFVFLWIFLTLAACSSPGPRFSGVDPIPTTVDGSEFDVYVLGDEVRIIRMNFEMFPTVAVIGSRAVIAIERVTGCSVVNGSFSGDQAMADVRVSC